MGEEEVRISSFPLAVVLSRVVLTPCLCAFCSLLGMGMMNPIQRGGMPQGRGGHVNPAFVQGGHGGGIPDGPRKRSRLDG